MTLRILVLVLVWVTLFRRVTPGVILSGLLVAAMATLLVPGPVAMAPRAGRLAALLGHELRAVGAATVKVARVVASRHGSTTAGVVDVALPASTSRELAWTSSLTTLTPGTFVVAIVQGSRPILRVHALDASRPGAISVEVLELHRRVQDALQPRRGVTTFDAPQEVPS